jgi:glutamine amidotransferase
MIIIVDFGLGNLLSIKNMLKRIGADSQISADPLQIVKASKLILPGVGHFDKGIENLKNSGLSDLLSNRVLNEKVPILGICLGAQLMTRRSEEGKNLGLGWIMADTIRFNFNSAPQPKVPHMGWSDILQAQSHPLLEKMPIDSRFYFVHSYHFKLDYPNEALTMTHYGYDFVSGFCKENIMGVQFHPEKSHKYGMKLLENFSRI